MDLPLFVLQMELAGRVPEGNLRETFEVMGKHVYCIDDLEHEVMNKIFV